MYYPSTTIGLLALAKEVQIPSPTHPPHSTERPKADEQERTYTLPTQTAWQGSKACKPNLAETMLSRPEYLAGPTYTLTPNTH